jgi:hypothetical protein
MLVRCQECGYENKDMYRFCGMCGASLREEPGEQPKAAPVAAAPTPGPPSPIAEAPKRAVAPRPQVSKDLSYLFEDEEPTHGHGKMYLALALLAVSLVLLGWHWYRDRQPVAPTTTTSNVVTPAPSDSAAPQAPQAQTKATPAPVEAAPEKTKESSPDKPPAQTEQQPVTDAPVEEAKTLPPAESRPKPAPMVATPAAPETRKPSASVPAAPAMSADDKLVADGEKYLYGNGVPENCDLAQKNIRTAANKSNARAQTLLGAMYATGHCISRDLPSAYRWFAKALHNDPGNGRIQSDLEMVWKQMTPGERQMATRSQ